MKTVDIDLNFIFLIMMLAIVLLAAITGFNVGRMAGGASGLIIWQVIFLVLSMALLALALLFPYMIYWVGHAAIILGAAKLASFVYLYLFHSTVLLAVGASMLTGEVISTILILVSGAILVKNNPKL